MGVPNEIDSLYKPLPVHDILQHGSGNGLVDKIVTQSVEVASSLNQPLKEKHCLKCHALVGYHQISSLLLQSDHENDCLR